MDNCSTDGTSEFLDSLTDTRYLIIHSKENIGGAGGFSLGLKSAVLEGCDYTWLMDDDTIPSSTALEELVKVTLLDENVGFVCSQVNWTDGKPHAMNKACLIYKNGVQSKVEHNGVLGIHCNLASFVSVLVNTKAVYQLGLPIKEFFIWCDDLEYTLRIANSYPCFYAPNSIVCHKTATNYSPSIDKAPANMAWRFYYSIRNSCYIKRKQVNRIVFFFSVLILMVLVVTLIYFIKINNVEEPKKDLEETQEMKIAKELRDSMKNNDATIKFTDYEKDQEDKAIISYDELVNKGANYELNYETEEMHDDLSVKKVDLDNLVNKSNSTASNIEVRVISFQKEEAFLEALKRLQKELG